MTLVPRHEHTGSSVAPAQDNRSKSTTTLNPEPWTGAAHNVFYLCCCFADFRFLYILLLSDLAMQFFWSDETNLKYIVFVRQNKYYCTVFVRQNKYYCTFFVTPTNTMIYNPDKTLFRSLPGTLCLSYRYVHVLCVRGTWTRENSWTGGNALTSSLRISKKFGLVNHASTSAWVYHRRWYSNCRNQYTVLLRLRSLYRC